MQANVVAATTCTCWTTVVLDEREHDVLESVVREGNPDGDDGPTRGLTVESDDEVEGFVWVQNT